MPSAWAKSISLECVKPLMSDSLPYTRIFRSCGHYHAGSVVTKLRLVDGRRLEIVTEGVHREERSHTGLVTEVILKLSSR